MKSKRPKTRNSIDQTNHETSELSASLRSSPQVSTPDSSKRELKKLDDYWSRNSPARDQSPRLRSKRKVVFDVKECLGVRRRSSIRTPEKNTTKLKNEKKQADVRENLQEILLPDINECDKTVKEASEYENTLLQVNILAENEINQKEDGIKETSISQVESTKPDTNETVVQQNEEPILNLQVADTDSSDSSDEDFIPPRKKLRSEINKDELWEGFPVEVKFKRSKHSEDSATESQNSQSSVDSSSKLSATSSPHRAKVYKNHRKCQRNRKRKQSQTIEYIEQDSIQTAEQCITQDIITNCNKENNASPTETSVQGCSSDQVKETEETISQILSCDFTGLPEALETQDNSQKTVEVEEEVTESISCSLKNIFELDAILNASEVTETQKKANVEHTLEPNSNENSENETRKDDATNVMKIENEIVKQPVEAVVSTPLRRSKRRSDTLADVPSTKKLYEKMIETCNVDPDLLHASNKEENNEMGVCDYEKTSEVDKTVEVSGKDSFLKLQTVFTKAKNKDKTIPPFKIKFKTPLKCVIKSKSVIESVDCKDDGKGKKIKSGKAKANSKDGENKVKATKRKLKTKVSKQNKKVKKEPNTDTPKKANASSNDKPSTVNMGKPSTPNKDEPSTPNKDKPSTPSMDKPRTPSMDKPSKFNIDEPRKSYIDELSTPNMDTTSDSNIDKTSESIIDKSKSSTDKNGATKAQKSRAYAKTRKKTPERKW